MSADIVTRVTKDLKSGQLQIGTIHLIETRKLFFKENHNVRSTRLSTSEWTRHKWSLLAKKRNAGFNWGYLKFLTWTVKHSFLK